MGNMMAGNLGAAMPTVIVGRACRNTFGPPPGQRPNTAITHASASWHRHATILQRTHDRRQQQLIHR